MIANWRLAVILGAVRSSGSAMSFQSVMTSARIVAAASRTPTVRMFIFVFMMGLFCFFGSESPRPLPRLYRRKLGRTIQGIWKHFEERLAEVTRLILS